MLSVDQTRHVKTQRQTCEAKLHWAAILIRRLKQPVRIQRPLHMLQTRSLVTCSYLEQQIMCWRHNVVHRHVQIQIRRVLDDVALCSVVNPPPHLNPRQTHLGTTQVLCRLTAASVCQQAETHEPPCAVLAVHDTSSCSGGCCPSHSPSRGRR